MDAGNMASSTTAWTSRCTRSQGGAEPRRGGEEGEGEVSGFLMSLSRSLEREKEPRGQQRALLSQKTTFVEPYIA